MPLAAKDLTNRQIAERLLLSDRTIGFHPYQAFPILGVTSRAQLRDALPGWKVPDTVDPRGGAWSGACSTAGRDARVAAPTAQGGSFPFR
ncbi:MULTISPECIES: helix-turn-helix domain-containing protein [Streptomyces]|uniref:Helix-turn-helix transcriptional regulator n=1 Tax=Streptomyces flaveolus TaxID=67297 RepID=A0ABV3ANA0_9ACTN|nr:MULTISPECIES: helix-turn-helix transcriptional regulator [Streptomyces]KMS84793.1 hypothetical protein ACZ91_45385 [Streptomyces regensis]KOG74354.1 hypothetical protein ADK77_06060 [Streptomyces antibioticus]